MQPMMPVAGMTGIYVKVKPECSLEVEVESYEGLNNGKGVVGLKVLRNLNKDSGCPYEEGQRFTIMIGEENDLESLILY